MLFTGRTLWIPKDQQQQHPGPDRRAGSRATAVQKLSGDPGAQSSCRTAQGSWAGWPGCCGRGWPCYLNVSFELLIVDVDGVLAAILGPRPEQAVGHLDVQQVVQHLHLGLEGQRTTWSEGKRLATLAQKTHRQVMAHTDSEGGASRLVGDSASPTCHSEHR